MFSIESSRANMEIRNEYYVKVKSFHAEQVGDQCYLRGIFGVISDYERIDAMTTDWINDNIGKQVSVNETSIEVLGLKLRYVEEDDCVGLILHYGGGTQLHNVLLLMSVSGGPSVPLVKEYRALGRRYHVCRNNNFFTCLI